MNDASGKILLGMTGRDLLWIAKATLHMFFLMVVAVLLIYFFPGIVT